jgi:hypothetical protein
MAPRLSLIENHSDCELVDVHDFGKDQIAQELLPRRRAIAFAISQDIYFTERCPCKETAWYSKQDTEKFKKDNYCSVHAMLAGKHRELADFCERGLETCTKAGSIQTKNRKKFALKAVLNEQLKQQENGVFDPEAIAQAYGRVTSRSRLMAAAQGQGDAMAAN